MEQTMKGKDWFILAIRLVGIALLYLGIQELLVFTLGDMFSFNMERRYLDFERTYSAQVLTGWRRLFYGVAHIVLGLLTLIKAGRFADWCYAGDRRPTAIEDDRRRIRSERVRPERREIKSIASLTKEQEDLLVCLAESEEGGQLDLPANGERVLQELIDQGLVFPTDDGSYSLTEHGEEVYDELTGEDAR
jgi:hypothetical protein